MKARQFYNKNQFIIEEREKNILVFQSYDSEIIKIENGLVWFGRNWDYSKTTLKHLYLFLNEYCPSIWELIQDNYKISYKNTIQLLIDKDVLNYDYNLI